MPAFGAVELRNGPQSELEGRGKDPWQSIQFLLAGKNVKRDTYMLTCSSVLAQCYLMTYR